MEVDQTPTLGFLRSAGVLVPCTTERWWASQAGPRLLPCANIESAFRFFSSWTWCVVWYIIGINKKYYTPHWFLCGVGFFQFNKFFSVFLWVLRYFRFILQPTVYKYIKHMITEASSAMGAVVVKLSQLRVARLLWFISEFSSYVKITEKRTELN